MLPLCARKSFSPVVQSAYSGSSLQIVAPQTCIMSDYPLLGKRYSLDNLKCNDHTSFTRSAQIHNYLWGGKRYMLRCFL